jgi:hypothetical protein
MLLLPFAVALEPKERDSLPVLLAARPIAKEPAPVAVAVPLPVP